MSKPKQSEPFITLQKQAIKTRNYIFQRNHSMKLERQCRKSSPKITKQLQEENFFVPKLKSKQLLREPKFFFSVERKKIKNDNSQPTFDLDQTKLINPQMKGSKAKALYIKMMMMRKQSIQECLKVEKGRVLRNKSFIERSCTSKTQCQRISQVLQNEKVRGKLEKCFPHQTTISAKIMKRPNLYQNISFLIRRKRQIKNRSTVKRINEAKNFMTEGVRKGQKGDEQTNW